MDIKNNIVTKKCLDLFCNNTAIIIFGVFLFVYLTFGFFITYFNDILYKFGWDVIYSIDFGKTFNWFYNNHQIPHIPTIKHHFSFLMFTPIIAVFKGVLGSSKLTLIVLQSIIQSLSVSLIFKTLMTLTQKRSISLLLTTIFGFSYTALLMSIMSEVYVWAGFSQILILYYIVYLIKNKTSKLTKTSIFLLSLLTVFCYGINIVNIASSIILIIFLLFKVYENKKDRIISLLKVLITITLIVGSFTLFQNQVGKQTKGYMPIKFSISTRNIINTFRGTYVEPLYSLKSKIQPSSYTIKGEKISVNVFRNKKYQNPLIYLPAILFILLPIIFYRKNKEKYKHCELINILLGITLLYTVFNYIFTNEECALFSLNYLPFFIVALGLMYEKMRKHYGIIIPTLFLLLQMPWNIYYLFKIQNFLFQNSNGPSIWICIFYSIISTGAIILITYILKKFFNHMQLTTEKKYLYLSLLYLCLILIYNIALMFLIHNKV